MNNILLTPPVAFLTYVLLVSFLMVVGRFSAGKPHPTSSKSSTYASGEESVPSAAAPGYQPFFKVALFFAVLHLGVVVLGSSSVSMGSMLYLVGLMLALVALILG
jgi:NADH:ubiquinone oxidoreductase subunit 3 (subunit A)